MRLLCGCAMRAAGNLARYPCDPGVPHPGDDPSRGGAPRCQQEGSPLNMLAPR